MQAPVETGVEEMVSIPRVFIQIPGTFSKPKFEPEYVLPLFVAVWKNAPGSDPANPVAVQPWPAELCDAAGKPDPVFAIARVPADDPVRWEELRLRRDFGDELFARVYPGSEFKREFAAFMRSIAPAAIPAKK